MAQDPLVTIMLEPIMSTTTCQIRRMAAEEVDRALREAVNRLGRRCLAAYPRSRVGTMVRAFERALAIGGMGWRGKALTSTR